MPPRELHFILLNTNIQHTLDTFKFERDSGNENMAKSIIYALEGLNPLALENSYIILLSHKIILTNGFLLALGCY